MAINKKGRKKKEGRGKESTQLDLTHQPKIPSSLTHIRPWIIGYKEGLAEVGKESKTAENRLWAKL